MVTNQKLKLIDFTFVGSDSVMFEFNSEINAKRFFKFAKNQIFDFTPLNPEYCEEPSSSESSSSDDSDKNEKSVVKSVESQQSIASNISHVSNMSRASRISQLSNASIIEKRCYRKLTKESDFAKFNREFKKGMKKHYRKTTAASRALMEGVQTMEDKYAKMNKNDQ